MTNSVGGIYTLLQTCNSIDSKLIRFIIRHAIYCAQVQSPAGRNYMLCYERLKTNSGLVPDLRAMVMTFQWSCIFHWMPSYYVCFRTDYVEIRNIVYSWLQMDSSANRRFFGTLRIFVINIITVTLKMQFLTWCDVWGRILRNSLFRSVGCSLIEGPKQNKKNIVIPEGTEKSRSWGSVAPEPVATKFLQAECHPAPNHAY